MKTLSLAIALLGFAALPALAEQNDITRLESNADVTATADRLAAGIEAAGAKLMARIDHGAGAKTVGRDIGASQLLIFGNPKVGTPVMEQNRLAGLILLETNTQPGMTPTSLAPEQAAHCGISFPELCAWIVEDASCDR